MPYENASSLKAQLRNMLNNNLQIGLVSTRRPDLLERTLRSFDKNLFRNFKISGCYANIDPAFGGDKEHQLAKDCIRDYLPKVTIREPTRAQFGDAVKWVWGQFTPDLALHLEDDWELLQSINAHDVYEKYQCEQLDCPLH